MMGKVTEWVRPVLVALVCAGLVACGGSGRATSKFGGGQHATVLRLASFTNGLALYPAIDDFAEAVERRSAGRLRITVEQHYGDYAEDAEQQIVRGVADREAELGWVHTGVLD